MASKLPLDANFDLEQQFILRMTDSVAAQNLHAEIESGVAFKENFTVEFKPDMRHSIVRYNGQVYQGQIIDLPCILESLKTTDKKNFYKTADICQMMICTQTDEIGPLRGTAAYLDNRSGSRKKSFDIGRDNREFQYLHGITPPLKNVLHRRFRKTCRKRFVDMPKIEKEVKQLLRADLQADNVKWEVIWSDPPIQTTTRTNVNAGALDQVPGSSHLTAPGSDNMQQPTQREQATADDEIEDEDEYGQRVYTIDRRDVFGDISSSSSSSEAGGGSSSDSSNHPSDDEHRQQSQNAVTKHKRGTASTINKSKHKNNLRLNSSLSTDSASPNPFSKHQLGCLKDELAAELLLSDSGDEQQSPSTLMRHQQHNDNRLPRIGITSPSTDHNTDDENELKASVAAVHANNSIGNRSSSSLANTNVEHLTHIVVDDDDDDDLSANNIEMEDDEVLVDVDDVDDIDDVIHRGGELLEDEEEEASHTALMEFGVRGSCAEVQGHVDDPDHEDTSMRTLYKKMQ